MLKWLPCADKARLTGELTRLQTQSRRSKQERDQLDNLLAASTHKQAQQEYQIQTLQVFLFKILISLLMHGKGLQGCNSWGMALLLHVLCSDELGSLAEMQYMKAMLLAL